MDDGSGSLCCVVGIILAVCFIVIIISAFQEAGKAAEKEKKAAEKAAEKAIKDMEDAESAYRNSLAQLKVEPTNSDLRQRTLELGRYYSHLARDSQGVTIFDEIALMNDINAVCGGTTSITGTTTSAPPPVSTPAPTPTTSLSVEDRLAKLSDLKAKGLIDEQEYDTRRKKILDEI